jgi:hypothetical protein
MGWVLAQGHDTMAWPRGHCGPERWLDVHDTSRRVVTAAVTTAVARLPRARRRPLHCEVFSESSRVTAG